MSNNTKDPRSPLETLQETAAALKREAGALAKDDPATDMRIRHIGALKETAVDLKRLAKGLKWIGLRWVPVPLKRTAAALMKLTPADIAEGEKALIAASAALDATASAAMNEQLLLGEGLERLEEVRLCLGMDHLSVLGSINSSLKRTAAAVTRASSAGHEIASSDLEVASSHLREIVNAIKEAKAKEAAKDASSA